MGSRGLTIDDPDPDPRDHRPFEQRVTSDDRLVERIRRGGAGRSRAEKALAVLRDDVNRHPHPDLPRPFWRWRMSWLLWLRWPRQSIENLQVDVAAMRDAVLEIPTLIKRVERIMADVSPILDKLAQDLRAWSAGPFADLLAENTRLASRNAELEGEDTAETAAAGNAVAAFNQMVAPVTESPDVPVEIPPVEAPVDPPADPGPAA